MTPWSKQERLTYLGSLDTAKLTGKKLTKTKQKNKKRIYSLIVK